MGGDDGLSGASRREHLPHLFDRSWQARETRRGGVLAVESTPGAGTRLRLDVSAAPG